jgi:hypothetical protein
MLRVLPQPINDSAANAASASSYSNDNHVELGLWGFGSELVRMEIAFVVSK